MPENIDKIKSLQEQLNDRNSNRTNARTSADAGTNGHTLGTASATGNVDRGTGARNSPGNNSRAISGTGNSGTNTPNGNSRIGTNDSTTGNPVDNSGNANGDNGTTRNFDFSADNRGSDRGDSRRGSGTGNNADEKQEFPSKSSVTDKPRIVEVPNGEPKRGRGRPSNSQTEKKVTTDKKLQDTVSYGLQGIFSVIALALGEGHWIKTKEECDAAAEPLSRCIARLPETQQTDLEKYIDPVMAAVCIGILVKPSIDESIALRKNVSYVSQPVYSAPTEYATPNTNGTGNPGVPTYHVGEFN